MQRQTLPMQCNYGAIFTIENYKPISESETRKSAIISASHGNRKGSCQLYKHLQWISDHLFIITYTCSQKSGASKPSALMKYF